MILLAFLLFSSILKVFEPLFIQQIKRIFEMCLLVRGIGDKVVKKMQFLPFIRAYCLLGIMSKQASHYSTLKHRVKVYLTEPIRL